LSSDRWCRPLAANLEITGSNDLALSEIDDESDEPSGIEIFETVPWSSRLNAQPIFERAGYSAGSFFIWYRLEYNGVLSARLTGTTQRSAA